jgi:hypothetical protein
MPKLTYETHKVTIASPYLKEYVEALKGIPNSCRDYKPHDRTWTIFHPYVKEARRLVFLYFPPSEIVEIDYHIFTEAQDEAARKQRERDQARANGGRRQSSGNPFEDLFNNTRSSSSTNANPDTADPTKDPYTVLYLLPSAPQQVVKQVYKALGRLYHPDFAKETGKNEAESVEAMKRVNLAYESIVKMKGWGR